jgi:tRNA modification GTPase
MAPPLPRRRRAVLRKLKHPVTLEVLDEALVFWTAAPKSETGEDVAELQVHGGRGVVQSVLEALAQIDGCRMAEPGEFARRAFENGRLDLAQAEGLADLIDAETEAQRRQALRQARGANSALYENWRSKLVSAVSLVEAVIDFADEGDVTGDAQALASRIVAELYAEIRRHLDDGHRGEILRDGFRVVLAGPPNVGKSSLLNALARRDVAIVSEEAGTTRDAIEVHLNVEGLPVIVTDTAGIREAEGKVEAEGIRRTLARARQADLVVWLMDISAPAVELPPALRDRADTVLEVLSKADLLQGGAPSLLPDDLIAVSAKSGQGLGELTRRLASIAAERIGAGEEPVITQTRHRQLLESCAASLSDFLSSDPAAVELRAEDLRRAAQALGRITGRVDVEDVLDQVFRRFCIGK